MLRSRHTNLLPRLHDESGYAISLKMISFVCVFSRLTWVTFFRKVNTFTVSFHCLICIGLWDCRCPRHSQAESVNPLITRTKLKLDNLTFLWRLLCFSFTQCTQWVEENWGVYRRTSKMTLLAKKVNGCSQMVYLKCLTEFWMCL